MRKADVFNWSGKKVSQIELPPEVFGERLNKPLLNEAVKCHLAKRRSGTHKAKTRGEVRGGGRKPFRQKGTGHARQGSIRSPLLEGGGAAHGPKPRDYGWRLPRKVRQKAFRSALSWLFAEKRALFMESMSSAEGKTKELSARLKKQGWGKALLADEKKDVLFDRACKNLKNFKFVSAESVNIYDLLKFDRLALTPAALSALYRKCGYARFGGAAAAEPAVASAGKKPEAGGKTAAMAEPAVASSGEKPKDGGKTAAAAEPAVASAGKKPEAGGKTAAMAEPAVASAGEKPEAGRKTAAMAEPAVASAGEKQKPGKKNKAPENNKPDNNKQGGEA